MTKEQFLFLKTFPNDFKNYNRMTLNFSALTDSERYLRSYIQLDEYHKKQRAGETNYDVFSLPGLGVTTLLFDAHIALLEASIIAYSSMFLKTESNEFIANSSQSMKFIKNIINEFGEKYEEVHSKILENRNSIIAHMDSNKFPIKSNNKNNSLEMPSRRSRLSQTEIIEFQKLTLHLNIAIQRSLSWFNKKQKILNHILEINKNENLKAKYLKNGDLLIFFNKDNNHICKIKFNDDSTRTLILKDHTNRPMELEFNEYSIFNEKKQIINDRIKQFAR